jgi:16S rRNA (guanine(966)-N(2))-methyltransferase RsmD
MRIIAGQYRSRPLRSLRGLDIRPTSDRLRETLFNVLTAGNPAALAGSTWLDLFAGTGAVGIEAISRGADRVMFVERSTAAVAVIRENLAALRVTSGFEVLQSPVARVLARPAATPADFIFLDPPYADTNAYHATLKALSHSAAVGKSTVVIAEHDKKFEPGEDFAGLIRFRKLQQGDAALSFYKLG